MSSDPPENIILDGALLGKLRAEVETIFNVVAVETPRQAPQGTIIFVGDLLIQDNEAAYDLIAERWRPYNYTPLLRRRQEQITLIAHPGVIVPKPSNPWINLGLFIITLIAVLLTGAYRPVGCPETPTDLLIDLVKSFPTTVANWIGGLPILLTIMPILLAHEFGHYFAARRHKVAVTLPYFIPLPFLSPVGTMGAFIQLRSPFKTKKQLFDIGVAGPLGGLIFAIPLILFGVSTSPVHEIIRNPSCPGSLEGNSIFYLTVKYLLHGQLLPDFNQYRNLPFWQEFLLLLGGVIPPGEGHDIYINAIASAAWFGLFVTAMNLMPIGQLDGGHVIYCLLGEKARWVGFIMVGIMLIAGIWWSGWLVWAFLVFFIIGPGHPPPLNELAPLGWPRTLLAYVMIFIFIVLFMPNPLQPM